MNDVLSKALDHLLQKADVPRELCCLAVGEIMDGRCTPVDIAAFLTAMSMKGPTAEELSGAASAMRARAIRIQPTRRPLLDTCGTGGDRLQTLNISTAAALVAAAAGVAVAKHGNRSVSSSSGSADVLEALGVRIALTPEQMAQCIDQVGIGFCFAPLIHGAMKYAAPVRRELGFPTLFNLLGPLTNPAGAEHQLLGASSVMKAELIASALASLGTSGSLIVCGNNELDEVSLWGMTTAFRVSKGQPERTELTAGSFGLKECSPSDLKVTSPAESAERIRAVFCGQLGASRDIVIANAAMALIVTGHESNTLAAARRASAVIDQGAALRKLEELILWTSAAEQNTEDKSR